MRYVPFLALVVLPLVLLPSIQTLLAVLTIGLPTAVALIPEKKPTELNPAIWHPDAAVRGARLVAAVAEWKRRNTLWRCQ
jgi:hypothetical protein